MTPSDRGHPDRTKGDDQTKGALGINLRDAVAINDAGQIAANGVNSAGQFHAFLLTPVPEPSAVGIAGMLSMLLLRRRRRGARDALHRNEFLISPDSDHQ